MLRIFFTFLFCIFLILFQLDASDVILPAEDIYHNSLIKIKDKNYGKAHSELKKLTLQYPFSELALKAEILSAYIAMKKKGYDDVISTLESYLKYYIYNTSAENLDYIYFMLAAAYFHNMRMNIMDLEYIQTAHDTFENLTKRIKNPDYADEIEIKFQIINEVLAERIYNIGLFYFKKKNFDAALYRFESILHERKNTHFYCKVVEQLQHLHKKEGLNIDSYAEHVQNCTPTKIEIVSDEVKE